MSNQTLSIATWGLALLPVAWQATGAVLALVEAQTPPALEAHVQAWALARCVSAGTAAVVDHGKPRRHQHPGIPGTTDHTRGTP